MHRVHCLVDERHVNPLFEVFDGGDMILSSYRDVEATQTEMQIFFPDAERTGEAKAALEAALEIVGVHAAIEVDEIPDEDWRFSYRRHFKTERIGQRLVVRPPWEPMPSGGVVVTLDPGLAFGTGRHETTRACLEYIEELMPAAPAPGEPHISFLDMGCGSGILSIAAALLGYSPSEGFDVDEEAVHASRENAALNSAGATYRRFALGRPGAATPQKRYDLVAANILGPLLIRFADEIAPYAGRHLIVSGILTTLYNDVLAQYAARGFAEISRKTYGEWTTGLLVRTATDAPGALTA